MKNQSLILLVVAVGCGLVAMLGVKQVISQKPDEKVEMIQVLSAVAEIQPGVPLDDLNTSFIEMAVASVPEEAVTNREEITDRYLKVPVMQGDWILKSKLTEKGQRGAEASIPPGMGIVTIPVDATTSHSGMLLPGNRIDLLLTYTDDSNGDNLQKTIAVLEFVEVFAVDNRVYGIDKGADAQAKNITLLVTPDQGKAVTLAGKVGTLSTMMRARVGAEMTGQSGISEEFLTSSFLGSNRDTPSVMDAREEQVDVETAVPVAASEPVSDKVQEAPSLNDLLEQELKRTAAADPGGSGPMPAIASVNDENIWTMEIYEGEELRLESIRIPDAGGKESSKPSGNWSMWDLLKSN